MNFYRFIALTYCAATLLFVMPVSRLQACTGITLKASDGAVVYGRTVEWGAFDLKSRVIIIPHGTAFVGKTPDGKPGLNWKSKFGVVGIDGLEKDIVLDGINERGLSVGVFYHPGFAKYPEYDPRQASNSVGPTDLSGLLLMQCADIKEVRDLLSNVKPVGVVEAALGFPVPMHLIVTEASGKSIVIEFLDGKTSIFENSLGVITNAPSFDWHLTNLRNYINLSPVAVPAKSVDDLDFKPLGAGSGMIGLPGDFTPPSRFVRAVAFSKTARNTADGPETIYELFRILDSFNVPLGAAEGSDIGGKRKDGMRSATIWTSACDLKNRVLYYHTQHNRRVRKVELDKIDFNSLDKITHLRLTM